MILTMNNSNDEIFNRIIGLMQTDDSKDAPKDSVLWAKNLFRTRTPQSNKSFVQKILAVLQIDLSGAQTAFGERSASATKARQMFFQAGENAVDLRISDTKKGLGLQGQILGEGFSNCSVTLGKFVAESNELSEFGFKNVPSGEYQLTIKSGTKEIVIESLILG